MKKIIFSTYDSINNPYYGGGGAIAIHQVAKRLCTNFKIEIIAGKYPGSMNKKIDGVNYKFIGLKFAGPKLGQLIYSTCLPYMLLTQKFDVWIESFTPPFSTGFLQKLVKKPVVGLVHMLSAEDMKRKYKIPFNLIENIGLKTYKYFIVNTDLMKEKIKKINSNANVEKIGNGIDGIHKKSGKNGYALFIGRLEVNQKGIDLLLNSWQTVKGKLLIAGKGSETQKVKKMVDDLALSNRVEVVGEVAGSKKSELFKNASFVVIPSRFETFCISALEAFSWGLPVISFDIGGLDWTPKGTTIKVRQFDINNFSLAISKLFKNNILRKNMGISGQKYAAKFNWDTIAKKYSLFLENI